MPVEGRWRAIAICMLKGHPEQVCDICSKPYSVGGTRLLSVTRPVKTYQLPTTEGEPFFSIIYYSYEDPRQIQKNKNRYLTVTCHTDMMEVAPGILG